MSNNGQPIYLDNDGLRDSVVEVTFDSPYNYLYIANKIHDTQDYAGFDVVPNNDCILLVNGIYRIQVLTGKISFNHIKEYQRWPNYSSFIQGVINILLKLNELSIVSLLIRYISVFQDISIFDNLNGRKMQLEAFPPIDGTEIRFNMSITDKKMHLGYATIRLTDNLPSRNKVQKASVVDLQIVANCNNFTQKETLEFLHTEERNLFFSLLDKSFINSLGAHYE